MGDAERFIGVRVPLPWAEADTGRLELPMLRSMGAATGVSTPKGSGLGWSVVTAMTMGVTGTGAVETDAARAEHAAATMNSIPIGLIDPRIAKIQIHGVDRCSALQRKTFASGLLRLGLGNGAISRDIDGQSHRRRL
jgi:hypothetical protein